MNKKLKKILLFLTTLLIVVGTVMLFMPSMIFTASVPPTFVPGNPHCGDDSVPCCSGEYEFKIDPPTAGTHVTLDGNNITIFNVVWSGEATPQMIEFDWSSDKLVYCVIVKAGDGANVYCYPGGSTGDSDLIPPGGHGTSHIVFCYGCGTTTTTQPTTTTTDPGTTTTTQPTTTTTQPTTTTTQPTTTTTQPTTTTTQPTTTTTQPTTTTTQPTTTTTVPGTTTTTEGTTTTTVPGTTTTTTPGTTTTTVPGTTTTTVKKGTTTTTGVIEVLAFTGYNSLWYVAGSILIALGIIMGTFSLSTALKRR